MPAPEGERDGDSKPSVEGGGAGGGGGGGWDDIWYVLLNVVLVLEGERPEKGQENYLL